MISILINYPVISGVVIGLSILVIRLFIFPIIMKGDSPIGNIFYLLKLKSILKLGHSLILYDVSSNGKEPQKTSSSIINDPLRIEDDLVASKVAPFVFYDPKTLKIKGYFHALNAEIYKDKYANNVYEGHLVLMASQESDKS